MNHTIAHVLSIGTLSIASAAHAADVPVNGLWNEDDGFGVWIYGRPGSCSQFQYQNPPFVVVGNGGKRSEFPEGKLNAVSLKVCMRATPPDVAFCTGGQIELRYEASTNEYVGSYRLAQRAPPRRARSVAPRSTIIRARAWARTLGAQPC
jgi:hypothetical protein